jgi:tetratricopeptide (TPR) repeat protein
LTNQISDPSVLTGLTLSIGFLGLGAWALVKGHVGFAFGIFLLYAAYAPVSNLIVPIGALVGERLFYLPSLGFCIVIAVFFEKLFKLLKTKYTAKLAVAVLTSVLAVVTICSGSRAFARNFDWENPYAFFKKTSATSPNSAVSHYSAAVAYLMMIEDDRYIKSWMKPQEIQNLRAQSDKGRALLIENGLNSISRALEITKEYPNVKYLNVYGALLAMAGKLEQARDVLVKVVDKAPDLVEAKITLGVICMRLASKPEKRDFTSSRMAKDYMAESLRYLQEAERQKTRLTGNPKRIAELYFNLSIVDQKLDRLDKATEDINDALFWLNKTVEKTGQGKFLFGRFYVIKASILAENRDFEGAIAALARAKQAGFPQFRRYALRMKQLRALHEHPGFKELIDGNGTN